jgi:hypothetical protein
MSNLLRIHTSKNPIFKDIHVNEECYIFCNEGSLKYMGHRKINNQISIGCNALFIAGLKLQVQ